MCPLGSTSFMHTLKTRGRHCVALWKTTGKWAWLSLRTHLLSLGDWLLGAILEQQNPRSSARITFRAFFSKDSAWVMAEEEETGQEEAREAKSLLLPSPPGAAPPLGPGPGFGIEGLPLKPNSLISTMGMMPGIELLRGVMQGTDGDPGPMEGRGGWGCGAGPRGAVKSSQLRHARDCSDLKATYRSPPEAALWASHGRSSLVDFPLSRGK